MAYSPQQEHLEPTLKAFIALDPDIQQIVCARYATRSTIDLIKGASGSGLGSFFPSIKHAKQLWDEAFERADTASPDPYFPKLNVDAANSYITNKGQAREKYAKELLVLMFRNGRGRYGADAHSIIRDEKLSFLHFVIRQGSRHAEALIALIHIFLPGNFRHFTDDVIIGANESAQTLLSLPLYRDSPIEKAQIEAILKNLVLRSHSNFELAAWLSKVALGEEYSPLDSNSSPEDAADFDNAIEISNDTEDLIREIKNDHSLMEQKPGGAQFEILPSGKIGLSSPVNTHAQSQEHGLILLGDFLEQVVVLGESLTTNVDISVLSAPISAVRTLLEADIFDFESEGGQARLWSRGMELRSILKHQLRLSSNTVHDEPPLSALSLARLESLVAQFNRLNAYTKRGKEYDLASRDPDAAEPSLDIEVISDLVASFRSDPKVITDEAVEAVAEMVDLARRPEPEGKTAKAAASNSVGNLTRVLVRHIIEVGAVGAGIGVYVKLTSSLLATFESQTSVLGTNIRLLIEFLRSMVQLLS